MSNSAGAVGLEGVDQPVGVLAHLRRQRLHAAAREERVEQAPVAGLLRRVHLLGDHGPRVAQAAQLGHVRGEELRLAQGPGHVLVTGHDRPPGQGRASDRELLAHLGVGGVGAAGGLGVEEVNGASLFVDDVHRETSTAVNQTD